jgi:general secretion pathway protein E
MKHADHHLSLLEVLGWLQDDELIDPKDAKQLLDLQKFSLNKRHPFEVIASFSQERSKSNTMLSQEFLTKWLGVRLDMTVANIDPLKVDVAEVTSVISLNYTKRFSILPLSVKNDVVTMGTCEPFLTEWQQELGTILHKSFEVVLCTPEEVEKFAVEFFNISKSVFAAGVETAKSPGSTQNLEQLMELSRTGKLDANDHHVVSIVDWLLQFAFEQRASDIHLEPRRDSSNVRFRIDGVMHQVYDMPTTVMTAVNSRLKILGRMNVAEKRRPQDGRMKTRTPEGSEVELRLSIMPTAFGEKMVMRIFDPDVAEKSYKEMGFSASDELFWETHIRQPNGIILLTGPTGSGKTTTLYSTLKRLAQPEVNVCTVEDPIEMVDPDFNQMQVQNNIGVDFASGIRTLLRQDPDIIMIGEIRDKETADMAIQASLTGHLVFSTLHTNDAPSAITRLREIGVEPYLINSVLTGVVAQRLVRKLCPHCKEETEVDDAIWKNLLAPFKADKPAKIYQSAGCTECRNTGYLGRVGIYEMMDFSQNMQKLVNANAGLTELRKQSLKDGMRPLRLSGAQKVADGMTTIEEILRVTPQPHFSDA